MTLGSVSATIECRASVESEKKILLSSENGDSFEVGYKLVRLEMKYDMFVIIAECGEEHEGVCLGCDGEKARRIFSIICRCGVMPSVLSETLADIE